ncbi:PIG-L deacetylase family protein [Anaerolineales bacterium HSG6]|nr:PIG-L deacetylase family protein [Anaerolineales bacterium HSG6]MDM8532479.1 PIG-L deacetylase family protein [Anaerolineales bacterium HSG25]
MTEQLSMMAIFAHPDDEAFGNGGSLAKYAHEGIDIHLVTATLGEAGQVADPDMISTRTLSVLREQELRCACQQYGDINLHLLGYIDGQTAIVPPSTAVYKIVKLLRLHKPQVVISFGPDGIYGHFDHLVIHRWSSAAIKLAAEPDKWLAAGKPYQVQKFYHRVMSQIQIDMMMEIMGRNFVPMDGSIPFPFVGYSPDQITTTIDVSDFAQVKLDGIRCHSSQLSPDLPYLQDDYDHTSDPMFTQETFILAESHVETELPETDLFAGLR